MNSGRLLAISAIVAGFGLAVLVGLYLTVQVSNDSLSAGGAIIGAFLGFVIIAPVLIFGIYMYVQSGREIDAESEMEQQRQLLDIVKSRGQIEVHELAIEVGVTPDKIRTLIQQLVGLEIFSGYINWDKGVIYSTDASQLRDLQKCENCGAPITLAGKGVIACDYCGTEYFLN